MKPVCVPCQRFFRTTKTGYYFTEQMPITQGAQAGTAQPELWKPYKVWVGDKWSCPDCGAEIVVGVPSAPLAEHYQEDFDMVRDLRRAGQLNVNDC